MALSTTEPEGDVRGEIVQVCIDGVMSVFQSRMREMLDEEGIENPDPRPEEWYPLAKFRNVLVAVEQNTGESALNKVGESTPRFLDWPAGVDSPEDGLARLTEIYESEHRNAPGAYTFESTGTDEAQISSTTPYPAAWESGLIKGTAQQFGVEYARVSVDDSGAETVFEVRW